MSDKTKISQTAAVKKCGIVMPISSLGECSAEHWKDVLRIIKEAIEPTDFEANLVSDEDAIGIIQKRIIQNIYNNEMVVCDVSGKNPNVMFELGMRLAFDKPTIIVKDDKTDYSFDTAIIEHLTYPRDLRFGKVLEFKESLSSKIKLTYERSQSDDQYSTFLKSFGQYQVASLLKREVSSDEFILATLDEMKLDMREIKRLQSVTKPQSTPTSTDKELLRRFVKKYVDDFVSEQNFTPNVDEPSSLYHLMEILDSKPDIKVLDCSFKMLREALVDYMVSLK